ncbi:MAG: helix-turn-helix transcriptional regulator [Verrucomicrobiales bacterium]|nr:helix-turn-helix transcriptional regulator [Verrucomicrobiales bacterium]
MSENLGDNLRRLRISRGLSLSAAAEAIDTAETYLSAIERNRRKPGIKILKRLSTVYFENCERDIGLRQLLALAAIPNSDERPLGSMPATATSEVIENLRIPVSCLLGICPPLGNQDNEGVEMSEPKIVFKDGCNARLVTFIRSGDSRFKIDFSVEDVSNSPISYSATWRTIISHHQRPQ